jgi:hypothetical protein
MRCLGLDLRPTRWANVVSKALVEHRLAAVLAADVVDFAQRIAVDEVSELERLRELRGDDLVGGFVIDECVKEQQAALCGRRPRRR